MKTYILHNLDKIAKYSKTLDAKAILYDKNWEVYNDNGDKEVFIFRPKGELLIVRKGIVNKSNWELLPTGSIMVTTDSATYLFNAAFVNNYILALQLDGTSECMVMIEANKKKELLLDSIEKVDSYLNKKYIPTHTEEEKGTLSDQPPLEKSSPSDSNIITYLLILFFILVWIFMMVGGLG